MSRIFIKTFLDSTFNSEHSVVGENFANTLPTPSYPSGYFKNSNAVTIPLALSTGEGIDTGLFTFPTEGSVSVWFKPSGWSVANTVVSDGLVHSVIDRATDREPLIIWRLEDEVGVRILFFDGVNPGRLIDCTTCTISDGVWHLASFSWSGVNNILKVYLDGVEVGSLSTTVGVSGDLDLSLGSRIWSGDQELDGDMDTFTFWNEYKTDWTDMNDRRAGLNDILPQ